jgi:homoserine dehydrogenase
MKKQINIGLFGFGCVGSGLYEVLNRSKLVDAKIKKIVVKDPSKKRVLPAENFSFEAEAILNDSEINTVVELISDSKAAYEIVKKALENGKNVVSANKKLIAEHLQELVTIANENKVSFLYEAAVAGSIPIIRNLEEYYNNDALSSVQGIVNGTTNYILTQANLGISYVDALKLAQEKGFAEADPTMDVDGFDAKYKLALLIKHAFGVDVSEKDIFNNGIRHIKPEDVRYAREKGYRIKLFARAQKIGDTVVGFVAPHFIKSDHPAYEVNNEFNAIVVEAAFSDRQLFIGKGAGSFPTASAVLSDISALLYDYKYEYRKSVNGSSDFSKDFYVRVYVGSEFPETINEIPFHRVDALFQSENYTYQIGWVKFDEIASIDFNAIPKLSLIVLPNKLKSNEEFQKFKSEKKQFSVEY